MEFKKDVANFATSVVFALNPGLDPMQMVSEVNKLVAYCAYDMETCLREIRAQFVLLKNDKLVEHCDQMISKWVTKGDA